MKKIVKEKMSKVVKTLLLVGSYLLCMCNQMVYASAEASTINQITGPIDKLKTLLLSVIASIGGIIIVKGIFEMWTSYQNADGTSMTAALKSLVGGLAMSGISVIVLFITG